MLTTIKNLGISLLPPEKVRVKIRPATNEKMFFVFIYDEDNILLLDNFVCYSREKITDGINERYHCHTKQIFVDLMIANGGLLIIENQNL